MDIPSLAAESRSERGKGAARRLRRSGFVPAVVYGINESTTLKIDPNALEALLGTRAGSNVVFQLDLKGKKSAERPVIVKELQRHPIQRDILHADFLEIRMDQRIRVAVPISPQGESVGVKLGGVLSQLLRELEVECLPNAIPEEIPVDITEVELNGVLHVRDLTLPEGVTLLSDLDDPVLTIAVPEKEEEPEVAEEELEEGVEPAEEGEEPKAEAETPSESSEG